MTNKELEKLFQSKLGSRKVDFDPSSWEGMERILDSKMPITPWYLPFASWIKGLTAAMVIGFSGYFIIGEPFEGYTKAGLPSESTNPAENINAFSNSEGSRFQNSTNSIGAAAAGNSRFSNQKRSATSSEPNGEFENGAGNATTLSGYAFADGNQNGNGPGKKGKRKNKKQNRRDENGNALIEERFVESDQLNAKPAPPLEIDYTEQALVAGSTSKAQTSAKRAASSTSPLKFGATLSAISSKNLLPESEGTINTGLKPAFAIGLVLAQPLSERWGLSGGLNYKWQKANASITSHDVNYSFGEEHVYTSVDYNSLNNIEVPISTYYKIAERHQVNLGVYASYLWAASAKYSIETIKLFGSEKETGLLFNNSSIKDVWDYGVTAGYYYSINSKFQIGVDSWFGLTPLQYNPDYDIESNNFQLRFSLNYWIL
jgi:hypothetical protein